MRQGPSRLLQVPLAQQSIGPDQVVGILMTFKCVIDQHLEAAGIQVGSNSVVGGPTGEFRFAESDPMWSKDLRTDPPAGVYDRVEMQFLDAAIHFFRQHPNVGVTVLECTRFPPFAHALQRELDIPLFSWGTLLECAYSAVVHRAYYGHV